jgi:hypothetical protein
MLLANGVSGTAPTRRELRCPAISVGGYSLRRGVPFFHFWQGEGSPALVRVHTVTLISSEAAVCVHQRSTLGHTNEIGSMPEILDELKAAYGRSKLFSLVTTDAGNTSCGVAGKMVEQGLEYFAQIKSVHGELHAEALDMLSQRRKSRAHTSANAAQNGLVVSYHLWRYDLTDVGWLDWTHTRQLVRVQRTAVNQSTGEVTVGNRYYVTSKSVDALETKAFDTV